MSFEEGPYRCSYCGWIYQPEKGYPKKGIEPGTLFADLPEDFRCPDCGAKLKWFEPCKGEKQCEE
jgi:rubredoxin